MTEETQSEVSPPTDSQSSTPDAVANKSKDNKKEKCRPMTKVVIRRLPPSMTNDQLVEQISPLPDYDYMYFVKADLSLGQHAFSRAYINFIEQQDIFIFREKFDNYVFVDSKGTEYPAVVEFAPFQRLPKKRVGKKKDQKCGTLKTDPYFISFLESLKNQEAESGLSQPKTEYSYQPSDGSLKKVTTTPLLEFLKQRKQEKQRIRDEKREERRRRDLERRRAKDELTISKPVYEKEDLRAQFPFLGVTEISKHGGDAFFSEFNSKNPADDSQAFAKSKSSDVLKNPDLGKEVSKETKDTKDEKDKLSPKEVKQSRSKKDEKPREKSVRERDQKIPTKNFKDREMKHQRRNEEKKSFVRKEERENAKEERKTEAKDERRNESREEDRDRDREPRDKRVEEKRGKSYEKMRQEKKRLAEAKRQSVEVGSESANTSKPKKEERESFSKKERKSDVAAAAIRTEKMQILKDESKKKDEKSKPKPESELESKEISEELNESHDINTRNEAQDRETDGAASPEEHLMESLKSKSNDHIDSESNYATDLGMKDDAKVVKRRSSLESGGEGGGGDGGILRRHKSLDGGDQCGFKKEGKNDKEKSKKDPRQERRIRNKDRPAMEIYRPGMGKFSKQRLEREKSSNDERASLSQSPTPTPIPISTTVKLSKPAAEVRSMTFKRSLSRDLP